jgi:hypothetical protein
MGEMGAARNSGTLTDRNLIPELPTVAKIGIKRRHRSVNRTRIRSLIGDPPTGSPPAVTHDRRRLSQMVGPEDEFSKMPDGEIELLRFL